MQQPDPQVSAVRFAAGSTHERARQRSGPPLTLSAIFGCLPRWSNREERPGQVARQPCVMCSSEVLASPHHGDRQISTAYFPDVASMAFQWGPKTHQRSWSLDSSSGGSLNGAVLSFQLPFSLAWCFSLLCFFNCNCPNLSNFIHNVLAIQSTD